MRAMRMSRRTSAAGGVAAVLAAIAEPTGALALTCRALEGGAPFVPSEIRDAPAAAVQARGSEKCDVVYRIDGGRYQLVGCNREYVGEWAKRDGAPLGHRHGRLDLACQ